MVPKVSSFPTDFPTWKELNSIEFEFIFIDILSAIRLRLLELETYVIFGQFFRLSELGSMFSEIVRNQNSVLRGSLINTRRDKKKVILFVPFENEK